MTDWTHIPNHLKMKEEARNNQRKGEERKRAIYLPTYIVGTSKQAGREGIYTHFSMYGFVFLVFKFLFLLID